MCLNQVNSKIFIFRHFPSVNVSSRSSMSSAWPNLGAVDDGGAQPLTAGFWPQLRATLIRNILRKKRNKKHTLRVRKTLCEPQLNVYDQELFGPIYFLGIIIILKLVLKNPHFDSFLDPPGPVDVVAKNFLQNKNITIAPDDEDTRQLIENINETFDLKGITFNFMEVSVS